jgi:hypothetical protein
MEDSSEFIKVSSFCLFLDCTFKVAFVDRWCISKWSRDYKAKNHYIVHLLYYYYYYYYYRLYYYYYYYYYYYVLDYTRLRIYFWNYESFRRMVELGPKIGTLQGLHLYRTTQQNTEKFQHTSTRRKRFEPGTAVFEWLQEIQAFVHE